MSSEVSTILDFSGYNLTQKDILERTTELKNIILGDELLKKFRTEDEYLLRFLYSARFNVELAYKKMQDFTGLTKEYPTWFATYSPLEKKQEIEDDDIVFLQERDKNGRQIVVLKLGKIDAVNSSPSEKSQIFDLWLESIMDDPKTQSTGFSGIVDMEGFSWALFKWFTPTNIRILAKKIDYYPYKDLLIHVVNTSFLFSAVIKIIWPFLSERLKNMFKFHFDNWPSLHEYIGPENLPSEYGGTGGNINFVKAQELLFAQAQEVERRLKFVRDGLKQCK